MITQSSCIRSEIVSVWCSAWCERADQPLSGLCVVWADHADYVSRAYSGTPALKTDFTRTGKRSHEGLIKDFWSSVTRYAKNNFLDGERQVSPVGSAQ